jgi:peptide/nickel transport system substrate-binding protein
MLDQFSADPNLNLTSVDSYHLTYLALNTQRAPMNDINVRKAISRALDIPQFQKEIIKNVGSAGTILPFGPALYGADAAKWRQYLNAKQGYTFDLAAARQHLAQSAYPNGFNCDLIVSENSLANQRALYIQEALKALNINVNIRRMSGDEQDTYQMGGVLDANGKRDYDMLIGGWESDYPDLNGNIEIMFAESQAGEDGYNAAAYINSAVDAQIELQRTTIDSAIRFDIHRDVKLLEGFLNVKGPLICQGIFADDKVATKAVGISRTGKMLFRGGKVKSIALITTQVLPPFGRVRPVESRAEGQNGSRRTGVFYSSFLEFGNVQCP